MGKGTIYMLYTERQIFKSKQAKNANSEQFRKNCSLFA